MQLVITERKVIAENVVEIHLAAEHGGELPNFDPGSHVTVKTPAGAMRRYSLVNDGSYPDEYILAIKREPNSRGGSASMHDEAEVGGTLEVSEPENDFPLTLSASKYLLIAGGIGITPIQAMARKLVAEGKSIKLIYCTRTPEQTAYLDEVSKLPGSTIHHSYGNTDDRYDFWDLFETPGRELVYCCGPEALMEEIKAISGHWPEGQIHFEDFSGVEAVRKDDKAFNVTLSRSGRTIEVPSDRSILEALRDAGFETVSSCESGTCGTCRVGLISGDIDHRDLVLMESQKQDNVMICVSRAKSGDLTLDL